MRFVPIAPDHLGREGELRYNAFMGHSGLIDFHCHLDDPCFDENRWRIIDDCFASGFHALVAVADPYNERSLELTAEMVSRYAGIDGTVGAHPHQANQYSGEVEKRILAFLAGHKVLAVGEVGLDFHYDLSPREIQVAVFRRQVAIAREHVLPLVIHSRQAEDQVLQILDQEKFALPVVFHCFTGDGDAAEEILRRGYFLSFSGIITFKNADGLRAVVAKTPLERLFSETDSPYLAPEPERGRTNSPLAVSRVAEKISAIKNTDMITLLDQIAKNYQGLKH
jgi:TatD DNase family protein